MSVGSFLWIRSRRAPLCMIVDLTTIPAADKFALLTPSVPMKAKSAPRPIRRFFRPVLVTLLVASGMITMVWMLSRESCSTVKIGINFYCQEWPRKNGFDAHGRLLRSKEVLEAAIELVKRDILATSPSSNRNLADLQVERIARGIEVGYIPRTNLYEVSFYHPDPVFASKMANAIAVSYKEYGEKKMEETRVRSDLDDQVELRRLEVAGLKERGGIVDPDPQRNTAIEMGVNEDCIVAYSKAKSRFLRAKEIAEASGPSLAFNGAVIFDQGKPPVSIWENAKPSKDSTRARLWRLWRRFVWPARVEKFPFY